MSAVPPLLIAPPSQQPTGARSSLLRHPLNPSTLTPLQSSFKLWQAAWKRLGAKGKWWHVDDQMQEKLPTPPGADKETAGWHDSLAELQAHVVKEYVLGGTGLSSKAPLAGLQLPAGLSKLQQPSLEEVGAAGSWVGRVCAAVLLLRAPVVVRQRGVMRCCGWWGSGLGTAGHVLVLGRGTCSMCAVSGCEHKVPVISSLAMHPHVVAPGCLPWPCIPTPATCPTCMQLPHAPAAATLTLTTATTLTLHHSSLPACPPAPRHPSHRCCTTSWTRGWTAARCPVSGWWCTTSALRSSTTRCWRRWTGRARRH
jgi:hypothetical protein